MFTRNEIEEGLKWLGELAQAKGLHIQPTLVGGAVLVLRFNARPSTRDSDAVLLFSALPRPSTTDQRLLVISAARIELLAQRNNQTPPEHLLYVPPNFLTFA